MTPATSEMHKALTCLYIAVDKHIADDVNAKVRARTDVDERMASLCGRLTGLQEAYAILLSLPLHQAHRLIDETIIKLSKEFNAELASRAKRT